MHNKKGLLDNVIIVCVVEVGSIKVHGSSTVCKKKELR